MRAEAHGRWGVVLVLVGVGAVAAGAAMVAVALTAESASFGWFAYAPLADATFVPPVGPGAVRLFGSGLTVVGVVLLAWWLGSHRSPSARAPFLPDASRRTRVSLRTLAAAAVVAVLAGGSLLLAAPPGFPGLPDGATPGRGVGEAYRSELTITWDNAYAPSLTPGLVLLVGGLVLCAVVLGRRAGRPLPGPDPGSGRTGRGTGGAGAGTGAGVACVVVGLSLALLPNNSGISHSSMPLGWTLLLVGMAVGAGTICFLLVARRRPQA